MDLSKMIEFSSAGIDRWNAELEDYDRRLEELNLDRYIYLDHYIRNELPEAVSKRIPHPFLTVAELRDAIEWMQFRGCRLGGSLLVAFESIGEEELMLASQTSSQFLPNDLRGAMKSLKRLNGVGFICASAILAILAPGTAPYASPEALKAVTGGTNITFTKYDAFVNALKKKSKDLRKEGENFTVSDLERALWISAVWSKRVAKANI